ncbi:MAG: GDSL-type esterase/lipase family protein [Verrucomicrobiota bacterium JB023]|nr:GDSL-type esterase/lipase family protein [Verrucomicrobiota bacterium JB023]
MVERLLEHGECEARLQLADPDAKLSVRSLAWTGDEVGHRLRLEGYAKHMRNLLEEWPADQVVLGYGLNESFAGSEGLDNFRRHYESHLKQLRKTHPGADFVLLSPIAIEGASSSRQEVVAKYTKAIAKLAETEGATFIDLFTPTRQAYTEGERRYTANGIHLNEKGNELIAKVIAAILGGPETATVDEQRLAEVAKATSAKHERVAEVVRPKNGVVYFGVRGRPYEYEGEMPRYHRMIELTEKVVHEMAADPSLSFSEIPVPSLPPMPEGRGRDDGDRTGIIKPPAEAMAEFTVADGFEVNLFASEEEFPELRNPVQIAFDARGRLWVVTMPSFPHTVPGLTPPDKIVILEDTDQDGKADKLTTFMEGLDALDGVAFHREGVIVSEQPRLWIVRDTDGDGQADSQEELLRGIDVTDSHHGGMIATDPYGDILFSDGVFHRSQLETPFGVHRGIDATTYRLDTNNGRILTEWQHTTPNPWKITHTRWGEILQMYGDGHVYDGTNLIWGPLGAYHPFRFGKIADYGKGSGVTTVSSSNFPDEYQSGIASASLLGRYAVTLTAFEASSGLLKRTNHLTILQSPNAAFRPADLEFGSDGALYVSDFCSPIIGHAQHPMRDPHWDHDFGRIWRVVHTKKPVNKDWPAIEGASLDQLCSNLLHPLNLVRHHTRIELRSKGQPAIEAIDRWLSSLDQEDSSFDQAALEALFVLDGLEQTRPELIKHLLNSPSERYRSAAIRTIRLQDNLLENKSELLTLAKDDSHPRVQIELIDAVAHLRPTNAGIETLLDGLEPKSKEVEIAMAKLDWGTEPLKGRSVPVLEVAKNSRLVHWQFLGKSGEEEPKLVQSGQKKNPAVGHYRTFIEADAAKSAIIALNHKALDVFLNESLVFSQDSLWSGDQQINVELKPGLNVLAVDLKKSRRSAPLPAVFLHNPVGEALTGVSYPNKQEDLKSASAQYEKYLAERGKVLRVQAAPELQFAPTELRVSAGEAVRLVFSNPDTMMHNWILLTPGSVAEVGALADGLAARPDGLEKEYLPDSSKILVASRLLAPQEDQEINFTAPNEPGIYPYICTFPGHWRVMKGELIVE